MFGLLPQRRLAASSLAALAVVLGAAVVAPSSAQTPAPKANAKAKAKIDLNKATAEEMVAELPGVGEATAKKIIDGRPYRTVDDLARAGVPERVIDGLRSLVTIGASAQEKEKPAAKPKAAAEKEAPAPAVPAAKVNLNTATADELQTLPGVGPAIAKEIIAARPFKAVSDLEKIKGLGEAKIAALKDQVTVAAAPAPVSAPTAKTATTKTAAAPKAALAPGKKVNINKAPKADLDLLPGIGPVKAEAIIEYRNATPFKTKEDVMKVRGIKEGEFAKIKDLITVD